jgi:FtsZ-binding cell division protein ZapB
MGVELGQYRACIGCYVSVFIAFMAKRIKRKVKVLVIRGYCDTVLMACLATYLYWGSLLTRCGDVELNPGPGDPPVTDKQVQNRQTPWTRLQSANAANANNNSAKDRTAAAAAGGGGKVGASPSPHHTPPQPTLMDVMTKLNSMGASMTTMRASINTLLDDVADIKERFGTVQEEVNELRREVEGLKHENQSLKDDRDALWNKVEGLERKTDDLECRSKRNNLIFYGLAKEGEETAASCETRLNELFTDRLELSDNVPFDRVHRLGDKPDAPLIARCTYYKDKVLVLKAKNKLKGTNIFVGEDFSERVRAIRKKLTVIMKEKRREGKQVSMVYDHLIMDGKKFVLNDDGVSVREVKGRVK